MTNPGVTAVVPVLAHQGGWDEALLVLVPLAVIGALLVLAKRRAERARAIGGTGADDSEQQPSS